VEALQRRPAPSSLPKAFGPQIPRLQESPASPPTLPRVYDDPHDASRPEPLDGRYDACFAYAPKRVRAGALSMALMVPQHERRAPWFLERIVGAFHSLTDPLPPFGERN